jgi:Tfp pilus assembly protein PilO
MSTWVGILAAIFIPICAAWAFIVSQRYRLERHRADAVAMDAYRKLAEESVANQQELRDQLQKLTEHVSAVERLMRDVG